MKADIYTEITDQIIAGLEKGAQPWFKPWRDGGSVTRPLRADGVPYSARRSDCCDQRDARSCGGRMTSPSPTLPFSLSARDRQAIAAYEDECGRANQPATDEGRAEWVREWRELDEEDRMEALDVQYEQRRFEP